ncbi:piggyBac transposable element-derived protein 4-like, partial [Vespula squamosa]
LALELALERCAMHVEMLLSQYYLRSYVVYVHSNYYKNKKDMAGTSTEIIAFRLDVAEQILRHVCIPDYQKRGMMSAGNTLHCLQAKQWGHFPRNIPTINVKKKSIKKVVISFQVTSHAELQCSILERSSMK